MAAEQRRRLARHLGQERVVSPRRVAEELLQALVIALGDLLADAPEVLARHPPQQPAQIVPRVAARIVAVNEEVAPEAPAKLHEASRHRGETGGVIFLIGVPASKSKRPAPGVSWDWFFARLREPEARGELHQNPPRRQELSSQSRTRGSGPSAGRLRRWTRLVRR